MEGAEGTVLNGVDMYRTECNYFIDTHGDHNTAHIFDLVNLFLQQ